jgi:hypothetical protein
MLSEVVFTPEKAVRTLRQNEHILTAIVSTFTQKEAVRLRDGEDGWNSIEILGHLADFETIYLERMRAAVEQDHPTFEPVDVHERIVTHNYRGRGLDEALLWFRENRQHTLDYLATLTPEQWKRAGIHRENGEMTVLDIAYNTACHDINHIEQMLKAIE